MTRKEKPLRLKATQTMGRPITWAQIDMEALEEIQGLMRRAPKAAELILVLIRCMRPGSGGVIVASRETMRQLLGSSMPTVERALRVLITEGFVQRLRIGSAHALAINHRIAWVGSRGDIDHAVFSATVIASRSEQDSMGLSPPPARRVPIISPDEAIVPIGEGLPPPSQPELPGFPAVAATTGEAEEHPDPWANDRARLAAEDAAGMPRKFPTP